MRGRWVLLDRVNLLKVMSLEADVVPVLLESLVVELLNALNYLVDKDWQLDLKTSLLGLKWAGLG